MWGQFRWDVMQIRYCSLRNSGFSLSKHGSTWCPLSVHTMNISAANRPKPGTNISLQLSFCLLYLLSLDDLWLKLTGSPLCLSRAHRVELRAPNWRLHAAQQWGVGGEAPACHRSGFTVWLIIIMAFSTNPGFPGWASKHDWRGLRLVGG